MAPYFFFSYAAENDDPALRRFFDELNVEVANMPGGPRGAAGYIDQQQRRGEAWDENLARALATTRVMVSLYTPIYFTKPYCGKEMELMLRRRRAYRTQHPVEAPSNIIPVMWYPCEDADTHRSEVARTLPRFFVSRDRASVYEREGLRFMIESTIHQADYVALKRSIAKDIVSAANRFRLPEERVPLSMASVRNAFVPQPMPLDPATLDATVFGPKSALYVYVGSRGWHSHIESPFRPPDEDGAAYICAAIAERLETQPRELAINPGVSDSLDVLEHVARNNGRVIVLIDSRVIETAPFDSWVRAYDERLFKNCATIVVGATTEEQATRALPLTAVRSKGFLFYELNEAEALARVVETSLDKLHDVIASNSDPGSPIDRSTTHTSLPLLRSAAA
jgi:hypothetical protein